MASSRSKLAWRTRAERGVEGWKPARRIRSALALATRARAKPSVLRPLRPLRLRGHLSLSTSSPRAIAPSGHTSDLGPLRSPRLCGQSPSLFTQLYAFALCVGGCDAVTMRDDGVRPPSGLAGAIFVALLAGDGARGDCVGGLRSHGAGSGGPRRGGCAAGARDRRV